MLFLFSRKAERDIVGNMEEKTSMREGKGKENDETNEKNWKSEGRTAAVFAVLVCLFYLLYRTTELFVRDDGDDSGGGSDEEPGGIYQYGIFIQKEFLTLKFIR